MSSFDLFLLVQLFKVWFGSKQTHMFCIIQESEHTERLLDNARDRHRRVKAVPGLHDSGAGEPHGPGQHLHGGVHSERHVQPRPRQDAGRAAESLR